MYIKQIIQQYLSYRGSPLKTNRRCLYVKSFSHLLLPIFIKFFQVSQHKNESDQVFRNLFQHHQPITMIFVSLIISEFIQKMTCILLIHSPNPHSLTKTICCLFRRLQNIQKINMMKSYPIQNLQLQRVRTSLSSRHHTSYSHRKHCM